MNLEMLIRVRGKELMVIKECKMKEKHPFLSRWAFDRLGRYCEYCGGKMRLRNYRCGTYYDKHTGEPDFLSVTRFRDCPVCDVDNMPSFGTDVWKITIRDKDLIRRYGRFIK